MKQKLHILTSFDIKFSVVNTGGACFTSDAFICGKACYLQAWKNLRLESVPGYRAVSACTRVPRNPNSATWFPYLLCKLQLH